jgi:choline dehydrogenase
MDNSFDYIVVGSGSAGGVIAARLSESGKYNVLCLEAGTKDENYIWTRSPLGGAFMIHNLKVNWNDFSEPNCSHGGRRLHVPHGKIIGGSSAINGTVVNRGQKSDYDNWAKLGCSGWGFDDVLPYFKRIERTDLGDDIHRGRSGPIRVTQASKLSPFYDLVIRSAESIGIPFNPDYCGSTQEGVAISQMNTFRGRRHSTANRYLAPARRRKNLTVLAGAEVHALVFEGKRCVGVRYKRRGAIEEVKAHREVIVCCGTVNSPKLLELSGIGNPELLNRLGISTIHSLPGVGENLRDHFGPTLKWTLSTPGISIHDQGRGWKFVRELMRYVLFGKGFMSQPIGSMRICARSDETVRESDIQIIGSPFLVEVAGGGQGLSGSSGRRSMSPINGFFLAPQPQRPESVGSVHITSADPQVPPQIEFRCLDTENDRRITIAGVRLARKIVATTPLCEYIDAELFPGPTVESDDEILGFVRETGSSFYHPAGTCKMGVDALAVVDERLRVRGIEGLRVADASIMPVVISGNTNIPSMMIGEKCADMVLADAL